MKRPFSLLIPWLRGVSQKFSDDHMRDIPLGLAIRCIVAVLLLTAAYLKLRGFGASSLDLNGGSSLTSTTLEAAGIQWELLLGLWLIFGQFQHGCRIAALATFSAFALRSLYLGSIGEVSCGCFGTIKTSPWFAFILDLAALALLVVWRPRLSTLIDASTSSLRRLSAAVGLIVLGVTGILGSIAIIGCWRLGGAERALAYLRNETLSVRPTFVDFGEGSSGDALEASVEVANWTDRPLRLIGAAQDCSFLAVSELPVNIAPNDKTRISMKLRAPPSESGGAFRRTASLWADDGGTLRSIKLSVGCRVRSP